MFYLERCPHCKKASAMMEDLLSKHPEYKNVEIERIEESKNANIADTYDYYYVPTFYVDGVKVHEGVPTVEAIENVYKTALA